MKTQGAQKKLQKYTHVNKKENLLQEHKMI
jgi:hypothetical protein